MSKIEQENGLVVRLLVRLQIMRRKASDNEDPLYAWAYTTVDTQPSFLEVCARNQQIWNRIWDEQQAPESEASALSSDEELLKQSINAPPREPPSRYTPTKIAEMRAQQPETPSRKKGRGTGGKGQAISRKPVMAGSGFSSNSGPLHEAALRNDAPLLRKLLERGDIDIDAKGLFGSTALHAAARAGSVLALEMLIEKGANTSICDDDGNAPIHIAAQDGRADVVSALLKGGAILEIRQKRKGHTPLSTALYNNEPTVVRVLLEHNAVIPDDALHIAAKVGSVQTMELLLDYKLDPNLPDKDGLTPLHYAAGANMIFAAERLIAAGAEVNVQRPEDAWTALHIAANKKYKDVVCMLLVKGAEATKVTGDGQLASELAAKREAKIVAKILRDAETGTIPEAEYENFLAQHGYLHARRSVAQLAKSRPEGAPQLSSAQATKSSVTKNARPMQALAEDEGSDTSLRKRSKAVCTTCGHDLPGPNKLCKSKLCVPARRKANAQQARNVVQTVISTSVRDFHPVLDEKGRPARPYRIALGIMPYITISGAQLNAYADRLAFRLHDMGLGDHLASIRKEVNAAAAHTLYFVLPSEDMKELKFPQSIYVKDPLRGIGDDLPVRMKEKDLAPYVHDLVTIFGLYKGTALQAREQIYNRIMQAATTAIHRGGVASKPKPAAPLVPVAAPIPAAAGAVRREISKTREKAVPYYVILDSD